MKKILIGLGIAALLIIGIYSIILNSQKKENSIVGGTLESSDEINIESSNFKKFKLAIKVDNQQSREKLNVQVIDPNDDIYTTFDVTEKSENEFNLDNINGTWKVKFTKANEDKMPYTYSIKYELRN